MIIFMVNKKNETGIFFYDTFLLQTNADVE